jgi:hypothetical protein
MRDGSHIEPFDAREVAGIDGVYRELIGDGDSGDHGVVAASLDLAASRAKRGGHSAERPGRVGVER